jgi:HSF-type DNA-binding
VRCLFPPFINSDAKLTSFQRQLNLYGFRRISKGDDHGAYFHPSFQRGREDLVKNIKRLPVSKNGQTSTREGGDRDGLFEVPTVPTSDPLIEFENLLGGNLEPPSKKICSNTHNAQPVYKSDEMDCPAPAPTPEEDSQEGMPRMSKLTMRVGFAKLVASNLMCRAAASIGSDGTAAKHMDSQAAHPGNNTGKAPAPADSTEEPPRFLRMSSVDEIKNILSLADVAAWRPLGLSQNSSSHGSESTEPETEAIEEFPTFDEAMTFLAGCV